MSKKQIVLWCALIDFAAFTAYVVYSEGYLAFVPIAIEFASSSLWGAQILVDFLLSLTVALGFVVVDARKRGVAYWPYVALTLTLGAIGPLAYLLHRERSAVRAEQGVAVAAQAA